MLMNYGNAICEREWKVEETTPPGYSRVYHVHRGEVVYRDEHRSFSLKPGCLYLFPSATPYSMRHNPSAPLVCTFLHIDIFPAVLAQPIEIPMEGHDALHHLFLSISASIQGKDEKLMHSLVNVFEQYCRDRRLLQSPAGPVSDLLIYIAEHVNESLSIADLCGRAGYNEQYFIRLFKKNVGLSPHRYIISYRLKEAIKLLGSDATISEIARLTGYGDIKAFSRAFKNNYGLSPSDFRKAYAALP